MTGRLPAGVTGFGVVGLLSLVLGTCGPATVGSLHPVTLQPEPREPSRIPEADPGASIEAADPAGGTSQAGSGPADGAGDGDGSASSKRTVLSGSLTEPEKELSLMEIAERERERRREAPPPMVRIDDRNIERRAPATVPGDAPAESTEAPPGSDSSEQGSETADAEQYWRQRVRTLRYEWLDLVDEERRLEERVNELRRDFYEEDDAYYRDAEIKPEWDQAWSELQRTRREVLRVIEDLDRALEDGRRAGALPGWLREGSELEPERPEEQPRERPGIAEPVEPDEVNTAREIDE